MARISFFFGNCFGTWLISLCGVLMLAGCGGGSQASSAEVSNQNAAAMAAEPAMSEDALEGRATNFALAEEVSASSVLITNDAALHPYDANAGQAAR